MEIHLPPFTSVHEVQFQYVLIKVDFMEQGPDVVFLCIAHECLW